MKSINELTIYQDIKICNAFKSFDDKWAQKMILVGLMDLLKFGKKSGTVRPSDSELEIFKKNSFYKNYTFFSF